jgi:glycosyltransferase involved in cell wall biosynthesis
VTNKLLTLSIVIPVFNEEHHIVPCLEAIAAQTVKPDEVIVVDNNSTDQTVELAKQFPFVRVIHEPHQGIVYTRDRGFDSVKSDIIGRIDADTILPHGWVNHIHHFYENPKHARIALTGGGYFYNIRLPKLNGWLQSQLAFRTNRFVMGHYILWGSNMAVPRELWRAVKDSVCHRDDIHEDLDLAIHLHRLGFDINYDAKLRVGVKLKRVWENRWQQRRHMARWPKTLRVHGLKRWWLGSVGNVFLSVVGEPYIFISEGIARLFGRKNRY